MPCFIGEHVAVDSKACAVNFHFYLVLSCIIIHAVPVGVSTSEVKQEVITIAVPVLRIRPQFNREIARRFQNNTVGKHDKVIGAIKLQTLLSNVWSSVFRVRVGAIGYAVVVRIGVEEPRDSVPVPIRC